MRSVVSTTTSWTASCVPLEHIYIISAEEFDQFVAYVAGHRGRVADILGEVSTRDRDAKTKKLFLFQHLYNLYGNKEVAAYLRNQFDELGTRVANRLKR